MQEETALNLVVTGGETATQWAANAANVVEGLNAVFLTQFAANFANMMIQQGMGLDNSAYEQYWANQPFNFSEAARFLNLFLDQFNPFSYLFGKNPIANFWQFLGWESGNGPAATGFGRGDVHLTTYDGLHYDFQAAGEFILTQSTLFGDLFKCRRGCSLGSTAPRSAS